MLWSILIAVFIIYWIWWRVKNKELLELARQTITDITAWPLIGHGYIMFGNSFDRLNTLLWMGVESLKSGGLISGWLGSHLILVVTNPDDIDVISKTCLDKPEILDFMKELFGDGSILAPETTLGCPIDTQSEKHRLFLEPFEICTELGTERLMSPWLRPDFIFRRLKRYQTFIACRKIMYDFIDKIIAIKSNTLKNMATKSGSTKKEDLKSVLEMMMAAGGEQGFKNLELREETLAMTLAGTDTSAVAVSYTCILLAQHPEVQQNVFEEIQEVVGISDCAVTAEALPRLKYLEAVLKESLRLYPPLPAILRKVTQKVTLPSGPTLVPGCVVVLHIWGTHRNPRHWGEDANQFRPERFLEGTPRHPAAFIPFSHAHRNCLGNQYAMMSMKTAVATLVRRYRILPAVPPDINGKYPPLNIEYKILMKDAEKFKFVIEPRTTSMSL